ncbi:hypothetical protein [Salsipaludibacter albus]|uniref:hypothetical protein n=1 Tax=Salsipaludibacter albus TaxID=2849650 RepID=UPI001EE3B001|nr:hypothetical protein [Salsipaludibacter albus]MBY5163737.1 hypothetical protein [Salsipaludibacter albus]
MPERFERATSTTIHVSLPARVAHDLDTFTKVQASILDRLGCGGCTSGYDIRWGLEDRFRVTKDLEVLAQ